MFIVFIYIRGSTADVRQSVLTVSLFTLRRVHVLFVIGSYEYRIRMTVSDFTWNINVSLTSVRVPSVSMRCEICSPLKRRAILFLLSGPPRTCPSRSISRDVANYLHLVCLQGKVVVDHRFWTPYTWWIYIENKPPLRAFMPVCLANHIFYIWNLKRSIVYVVRRDKETCVNQCRMAQPASARVVIARTQN